MLYLSNDIILARNEIKTLISTLANNGFQKEKLLQIVILTISKTPYHALKFKVKDLINLFQGMVSSFYIL